ncbi:MAG: hypothetical protein AAF772_02325 [Acidobacteriota bacterium]
MDGRAASPGALVAIALAWALYYALHSALATDVVKRRVASRWPRLFRRYRLLYNVSAVVLLVPPVALTLLHGGAPLWAWTGALGIAADVLALAALVGFVATFFVYDLGAFAGLRRASSSTMDEDVAALRISVFHRFVRHPWYFFALVMVWTRAMDAAFLTAAVATTLYLAIGSRIEEQRLIARHGDRYRRYRRAVPGLVPRPWRTLSVAEARMLQKR